LVAWFEVYFSKCHIPIRISTSPYMKDTHWKQTIFYFEETINVRKGDIIEGSIAVKKSEKNFRDLDIKISVHCKGK
jgi:protein arginine N-methyltransferase 1